MIGSSKPLTIKPDDDTNERCVPIQVVKNRYNPQLSLPDVLHLVFECDDKLVELGI
jgi:hypothetical protein